MSVERTSAVWGKLPSCYTYTTLFFSLSEKKTQNPEFTAAMLFIICNYFLLHIALFINLFLLHVSWDRDSIF